MPELTESSPAIRIRMYRVGFGDCFLVSLPGASGPEHILIDCGVHSRGDAGTLPDVVKQIAEETSGQLALVIATHAHQDHISGFAAYAQDFRAFKVREVWLPWTENPKDATAVRLRSKQAAATDQLTQHFAARPGSGATFDAAQAALENLRANTQALALLKSGINGGTVRFLEAGYAFSDAAGIQGLAARILGPPRDEKFLSQIDPPADERLFRMVDGAVTSVNGIVPFEAKWTADPTKNPFYEAITERDKNLLAVAATNAEGLALSLDRMMNNTSLVVLFTFGGKHLLFPGDAQFGNWESWIGDENASGLLADVNFYKVAHHGSFNATPKSVLENFTERNFAAMASTQNQPWDTLPLKKLMDALAARSSGIVRSDSIPIPGAPEGPAAGELPNGFQQGKFWFDYLLPIEVSKSSPKVGFQRAAVA